MKQPTQSNCKGCNNYGSTLKGYCAKCAAKNYKAKK